MLYRSLKCSFLWISNRGRSTYTQSHIHTVYAHTNTVRWQRRNIENKIWVSQVNQIKWTLKWSLRCVGRFHFEYILWLCVVNGTYLLRYILYTQLPFKVVPRGYQRYAAHFSRIVVVVGGVGVLLCAYGQVIRLRSASWLSLNKYVFYIQRMTNNLTKYYTKSCICSQWRTVTENYSYNELNNCPIVH